MVKKAEITNKIIKIIVNLIGKALLAFVLFFRSVGNWLGRLVP